MCVFVECRTLTAPGYMIKEKRGALSLLILQFEVPDRPYYKNKQLTPTRI